MRSRLLLALLISTTLTIVGCSESPPVVKSSGPAPSHEEVIASWSKYITHAKSIVPKAKEEYLARYKSEEDFEVKWSADEVVKSDSISSPWIATVDFTVEKASNPSNLRTQYSLRFVPVGPTWHYQGGTRQILSDSKEHSEKEAVDYPKLLDWVHFLFERVY